ITYLALTDHNTVNGLPEFLAAAKGTSMKAIPGAEITCELEKAELHILALNLPEQSYGKMQSFVDDAANRSEMSKRILVQNLQRAGYDLDFNEIKANYPAGKINRSHIARELVKKGYVATVSEAMGTLLSETAGYYQPAKRLNAVDVIHEIVACEAIPVWAHPFLALDREKVDDFLKKFVPEGLVGMEVYYSTYTDEQTDSARELAQRYGLKASGGSDFHGAPKPDIQIGIGRGNLNIPEAVAQELLSADRKR
ncbi:MAG: hypothetical protein LUD83_00925, partial [Clostridiales bacterium]|nr:hypothetical protein [Clostridiales bacterium]